MNRDEYITSSFQSADTSSYEIDSRKM